jgi:O-antigen ligase
LIALYGIGLNYVVELLHTDPNDGLRLYFITDVFKSIIDTSGLGIGYGKESVRWRYHFPGLPDFTFLPNPDFLSHARMLEALSTGVHNSFAQALLRSGVLGCLLLIIAFFAAFPTRKVPGNVRNHAASLFAIMFIACFVNPALESPIQAVGVGFVYGYLLALNARARLGAVQIRWSARIAPIASGVTPVPAPALVHAPVSFTPKPDIRLPNA